MKKVLFGITSLGLGGAERVLVDLSNRLVCEYEITILTIYPNGELEKQLNNKVKCIHLYKKPFSKYNKLQKIMISLKLLLWDKPPKGYDTYISFLEGPITRLFAKRSNNRKKSNIAKNKHKSNNKENTEKIENPEKTEETEKNKKIVWVHNDISKVFGSGIKARIKKSFDTKIYKKYDKIVFVSEENREDFNKQYKNNFDEVVIRNYLDYNRVLEKAEEKLDLPYKNENVNLVSVCRLVKQKAIDRFIKVHSDLEKEGIHSKVYIVGDGPEREKLEEKIKELKEENNFFLLGPKENPYPYIKNANYFCLLSNYEGYGMVLDEAKILNKSIIITDTASRESIEDYTNGIILENSEKGIYKGLKKTLISDIIITDFDEKERIKETEKYYNNIILEIKSIIN